MNDFKNKLRAIIATAGCNHCSAFPTCKGMKRCGAFVPSAELYEKVQEMARKEVK
jgi:hypothetical protein